MMIFAALTAYGDAPAETLREAARFVPQGAEFTSTNEDAVRLELTYKDSEANEYRVLMNK